MSLIAGVANVAKTLSAYKTAVSGVLKTPDWYTAVAGIRKTLLQSIIQYTIQFSADTGGYISGATSQTINAGGNGTTVTAVANSGYAFDHWSNGSYSASITPTNVQASASYVAYFRVDIPTASFNTGCTASNGINSSNSSSSILTDYTYTVTGALQIQITDGAGFVQQIDATVKLMPEGITLAHSTNVVGEYISVNTTATASAGSHYIQVDLACWGSYQVGTGEYDEGGTEIMTDAPCVAQASANISCN